MFNSYGQAKYLIIAFRLNKNKVFWASKTFGYIFVKKSIYFCMTLNSAVELNA